jgi:hypothetical protein
MKTLHKNLIVSTHPSRCPSGNAGSGGLLSQKLCAHRGWDVEYSDATQQEEVWYVRQEKDGREGNVEEISKENQLK